MSAQVANLDERATLDSALERIEVEVDTIISTLRNSMELAESNPPGSLGAMLGELRERVRGLDVLQRMIKRLRTRITDSMLPVEPQSGTLRHLLTRHLLPILDSIDGGVAYSPALEREIGPLPDADLFVSAYEQIRGSVDDALAQIELLRMSNPASGSPFKDALHECVGVVEQDELQPGSIVAVVRAGYSWHGDVLRPCEVTCTPVARPASLVPPADPLAESGSWQNLSNGVPELTEGDDAKDVPPPASNELAPEAPAEVPAIEAPDGDEVRAGDPLQPASRSDPLETTIETPDGVLTESHMPMAQDDARPVGGDTESPPDLAVAQTTPTREASADGHV